IRRPKQPYRAPDAASFFHRSQPEYVRELLSPEAIRRTGIFDAPSVAGLVRRCVAGRVMGVGENQALVAILSTQLWHQSFMEQIHGSTTSTHRGGSRRPGASLTSPAFCRL